MSHLNPGDENMHYCDNSHRWIAPPQVDQDVWAAQVRDHMRQHLNSEERCGPARRPPAPPATGWPVHPQRLGTGGRFKVERWPGIRLAR